MSGNDQTTNPLAGAHTEPNLMDPGHNQLFQAEMFLPPLVRDPGRDDHAPADTPRWKGYQQG